MAATAAEPAMAQDSTQDRYGISWQTLRRLCEDKKLDSCDFFFWGVFSAAVIYNSDRPNNAPLKFCLPTSNSITNATGIAVIRKFVEAHPEAWHIPVAGVAAAALSDAYPCR